LIFRFFLYRKGKQHPEFIQLVATYDSQVRYHATELAKIYGRRPSNQYDGDYDNVVIRPGIHGNINAPFELQQKRSPTGASDTGIQTAYLLRMVHEQADLLAEKKKLRLP
jgi:succinylglutamate desuccinylase